MTTLNNHYNIMPSRVPRRVFALRAIAHYEGKLKFISFQSYEKQYQHWLSLILKANQICWFPWLWKSIPTLAFAHCESNPNSMVSASPEINPTLVSLIVKTIQFQWFSCLQKQFQHWLPLIAKANQILSKLILYSWIIHITNFIIHHKS